MANSGWNMTDTTLSMPSQQTPGLQDNETALVVTKTFLLVLLAILNLISNSIVCVLVITDRQLHISLRNVALASLAGSEIFMVSPLVFQVMTMFGAGADALMACNAFANIFNLLVYVSILHMLILSIDRYVAVFSPLHYRMIITTRRMTTTLVLAWFVPTLSEGIVSTLMIKGNDPSSRSYFFGCSRYTRYEFSMQMKIHIYLSSIFLFALPLVVMIVAYIKIAKVSWYQSTRLDPMATLGVHSRRRGAREMKWAKTIGMVIGAFLTCYLPIMIMYLRRVTHGPVIQEAEATAFLAYISAIITPAIYTLRSRDFRRAMTSLCTRQGGDVMPDDLRRGSVITLNGVRRDSETALNWIRNADVNELSSTTNSSFSVVISKHTFEEVMAEVLRVS